MTGSRDGLAESLLSKRPVEGLTHNFYRYPARFSPQFVREVIHQFSRRDDCVLDAFMGGGTTVVEALAAGRKAVGIDINPLAHFVTSVKTTPLSSRDKEAIAVWANGIFRGNDMPTVDILVSDPRLSNVPNDIKSFLIYASSSIQQLGFRRQKLFARGALLRLGQWAIDCRKDIPSLSQVRARLLSEVNQMLMGLDDFVESVTGQGIPKNKITGRRILYLGSVNDVIKSKYCPTITHQPPTLVLTSPPYPGVHVLYHRWQVNGRRETPAPYWLADLRDGHGESFYTLGGRSQKGLKDYFIRLTETFTNLRYIIDRNAIVVQLVAFSNPDIHLPAFLTAMTLAGYEEIDPFDRLTAERLIRRVPNRKWYTQLALNQSASNEILLFHRLRR